MMKHTLILSSLFFLLLACAGGKTDKDSVKGTQNTASESKPKSAEEYDPKRGQGKWNAENIGLTASLDAAMADEGEKFYSVKCSSCHKLTSERLVGPGWAGVTSRRSAEWLMNFITDPDPMITKDPALQAQLELCLVRMPNQNLSDTEARALLEFMRENDGVK